MQERHPTSINHIYMLPMDQYASRFRVGNCYRILWETGLLMEEASDIHWRQNCQSGYSIPVIFRLKGGTRYHSQNMTLSTIFLLVEVGSWIILVGLSVPCKEQTPMDGQCIVMFLRFCNIHISSTSDKVVHWKGIWSISRQLALIASEIVVFMSVFTNTMMWAKNHDLSFPFLAI